MKYMIFIFFHIILFVSSSFSYEARISLNILPTIKIRQGNNINLIGNTDKKFNYIVYNKKLEKTCMRSKLSDIKDCLNLKDNKTYFIILNPIIY